MGSCSVSPAVDLRKTLQRGPSKSLIIREKTAQIGEENRKNMDFIWETSGFPLFSRVFFYDWRAVKVIFAKKAEQRWTTERASRKRQKKTNNIYNQTKNGKKYENLNKQTPREQTHQQRDLQWRDRGCRQDRNWPQSKVIFASVAFKGTLMAEVGQNPTFCWCSESGL